VFTDNEHQRLVLLTETAHRYGPADRGDQSRADQRRDQLKRLMSIPEARELLGGIGHSDEALFDDMGVVSQQRSKGGPKFLEGARFDNASFNGGGSFVGADFGKEEVSFREPVKWTDSLKFDWDADFSSKPSNVKPDIWPPVALA
jgi:hypothetical protein